MGSKVSTQSDETPTRRSTASDIKCRRHVTKNVTFFNKTSRELMCSACFRNRTDDIFLIDDYVRSTSYKQEELKVTNRLHIVRTRTEKDVNRLREVREKAEENKQEMLTKLENFVKDVIDLIEHLKDELKDEIVETLRRETERLDEIQRELVTRRETLQKMEDEKSTISNKSPSSTLQRFLNWTEFLRKNETHPLDSVYSGYQVKMNSQLRLNEVLGRRTCSSTRPVLGELTANMSVLDVDHADEDLTSVSDVEGVHKSAQDRGGSNVFVSPRRTGKERPSFGRKAQSSSQPGEGPTLNRNQKFSEQTTEQKRTSKQDMRSQSRNRVLSEANIRETRVTFATADADRTDTKTEEAIFTDESTAAGINQERRDTKVVRFGQQESLFGARDDGYQRNHAGGRFSQVRSSAMSVVTPSGLVFSPRGLSDVMNRDPRLREPARVADIVLPKDGYPHNIVDSVFLFNGQCVLVDQKNKKLVLLDAEFKLITEIQLPDNPHNATVVPDQNGTIAVSFPQTSRIMFIDVTLVSKQLPVSKAAKGACMGIAYVSNALLYTSENDVLIESASSLGKTSRFFFAFKKPISLMASSNGHVFVTCYGKGQKTKGELVEIDMIKENIVRMITSEHIRKPVCCSTDSRGLLYVCDVMTPFSVHQILPNGEYSRTLLQDSKRRFQHINFKPGTDLFVVAENDSDTVSVFEMKHTDN